mmetsp:Transcript_15075/g.46910  ORF Transcript_15075/g.46910 Transcript_15075/m.46910 type:complete len:287 (-) Transcript_15075:604-1464(-)
MRSWATSMVLSTELPYLGSRTRACEPERRSNRTLPREPLYIPPITSTRLPGPSSSSTFGSSSGAAASPASAAEGAASAAGARLLSLSLSAAATAFSQSSQNVLESFSSMSAHMSILGSAPRGSTPTCLAGTPAHMVNSGTSLRMSEPAAMAAPVSTCTLPITVAMGPISTPAWILGWRSPPALPVPPSVTPCMIETLLPSTAVSPITTPSPWSIRTPCPKRAPGCVSTPSTSETRDCSMSASWRLPRCHSACAQRCACTAWKPLRCSRPEQGSRHAGSRTSSASRS